MKHWAKSQHPGGFLRIDFYSARAGSIADAKFPVFFQIFDQTGPVSFFNLQAAYIHPSVIAGRIWFHPGFPEGVFRAVEGKKGPLSGGFYQAVTAAVLLIRDAYGCGDPQCIHLLCDKISVYTPANRGDKGVRDMHKAENMGYIVSASSDGHGLGIRAEIFLRPWKVVDVDDNIRAGGTDDQCGFHGFSILPEDKFPIIEEAGGQIGQPVPPLRFLVYA